MWGRCLLAGCSAEEKTATAAASLSRYIVLATNQQFARAVNDSMAVANTALVNALTVMEIVAEPPYQLNWAEEGTREVQTAKYYFFLLFMSINLIER